MLGQASPEQQTPQLAQAHYSLAMLLRDGGDDAGALVEAERALEIYEQVHGPAHPDVAAALSNLGVLAAAAGDLDAAPAA